MKKLLRSQKGFTLIEILLVVAAIAILAGIVIVAINPGKQLGDTRNAQRRSDVTTLLNAVYQYSLDNNGIIPASISASTTEICAEGAANCNNVIDLSVLTANQKYLVSIPQDPQKVTANGDGYTIEKSTFGRITVTAPLAEQGAVITVSR